MNLWKQCFLAAIIALCAACSGDDGSTGTDAGVNDDNIRVDGQPDGGDTPSNVSDGADAGSVSEDASNSPPDSGTTSDMGMQPDAGGNANNTASPDPGEPLFDQVGSYETTIAASGDPATVYHPMIADLAQNAYDFPVVVVLQGADVEKDHYAQFASTVASYGFVVIVPNHSGFLGLYSNTSVLRDAFAHMKGDGGTTLGEAIDTSRLGVVGHSYGGVVGLYAIQNECPFMFCEPPFERPTELLGGAFYGTNMNPPFGGNIAPVLNDGIPIMLIQGTLDGNADPADGRETFDQIADSPKSYVELTGANHFGITDTNNPSGAAPDNTQPTLDQAVAVETTGRWAAMFLRAHVVGDADAVTYVQQATDPNVSVTNE